MDFEPSDDWRLQRDHERAKRWRIDNGYGTSLWADPAVIYEILEDYDEDDDDSCDSIIDRINSL